MKQQKIDGNKTLSEIQRDKNPTVWEVGRKFDYETNTFNEVNGRPQFYSPSK